MVDVDVRAIWFGISGPAFHVFGRRDLRHAGEVVDADVWGSGGNFGGTCPVELSVPAQNIMTLDVGYACGWSQHEDDVIVPDNDLRGAQLLRPQRDLLERSEKSESAELTAGGVENLGEDYIETRTVLPRLEMNTTYGSQGHASPRDACVWASARKVCARR